MKTGRTKKQQQPVLITLKDASEKLRISRQTITNWMDSGAMPGLRTTNSIWVSKEAVDVLCTSNLNVLQDEIDKLSKSYKLKTEQLRQMEKDVDAKISHMTKVFEQCSVPEALTVVKKTMVEMFSDVLRERERAIVEKIMAGTSIREVSAEYGLSEPRVWQIFNHALYEMSLNAVKSEENKKLREENQRLKEEHEVMKKAYLEVRKKNEQLDAKLQTHNIICENVELPRENMLTEEEKHMILLLQTKIYDLNLSARTYNALTGNNIETLGDLVKHTKRDLLGMFGFGKKSLTELEDLLEELNLDFGWDVDNLLLRKADQCAK